MKYSVFSFSISFDRNTHYLLCQTSMYKFLSLVIYIYNVISRSAYGTKSTETNDTFR